MRSKSYLLVSGALFALVGLAHLIRIINGLPVTAGSWQVPVWVSWIGLLVAAALSAWAFTLVRRPA